MAPVRSARRDASVTANGLRGSRPSTTQQTLGMPAFAAEALRQLADRERRTNGPVFATRRPGTRRRHRVRRARFDEQATLEDFDFHASPKLTAAQIRDLADT